MTESHCDSAPSSPSVTLRLIFEYEGTDIRLIFRQRVAMAPPMGGSLRECQDIEDPWVVEVRDAEQQLLYQNVMPNPIRHDAEVFSDDPDHSLARVPVEVPKGAFEVLIPDVEYADHVAFISSPSQPQQATAEGEAHFSLGPDTGEEEVR
ncbi:hypothetical protein ACFCYH_18465 [Streptomyces sp. NPDC056400]|uniref:hypothetical protein n=1 Tax=unclassified Streptomyces TaxID=2593676 RepID=UPI0035D88188